MVYDCFTFFNELDLLEIRLNILNDYVDKFVLVEATKTFTGNSKELFFNISKETQGGGRFKKFEDKIIHVVVDDYPEFKSAWTYESHQRNCIMRGLVNCNEDDIILISDLDEIPDPEKVVFKCKDNEVVGIEMLPFMYFINYCNYGGYAWDRFRMLKFKTFKQEIAKHRLPIKNVISAFEDFSVTTPNLLRLSKANRYVKGGWHFSYLGGVEAVKAKLSAFSHQEFNTKKINNDEFISEQIEKGRFSLSLSEAFLHRVFFINIDSRFPKYIQQNVNTYPDLFLVSGKEKKFSIWMWRSTSRIRRNFLAFCVGNKMLVKLKNGLVK